SGLSNCGLQVIATPSVGTAMPSVCASGGASQTNIALAPGGFYTANADITLPTAGNWSIVGECTCTYSVPTQAPAAAPKIPNLGFGVSQSAVPSLVPETSGPASGLAKLITPPIGVKASS